MYFFTPSDYVLAAYALCPSAFAMLHAVLTWSMLLPGYTLEGDMGFGGAGQRGGSQLRPGDA
eukprot:2024625-Rhodomonas_salina.1